MIGKDAKVGIAVLTLVLVASGCGGGGEDTNTDISFTPNQGIAIQNFSTYPGRIYEGQQATVRITVRNTGQADAEDTVARIYGAPIEWGNEPSGQDMSRTFDGTSEDQHKEFNTLRAGDQEGGVPSVPQQKSWQFDPPDLGDRNIDYDFKTRVFYKYETTGETEIQLVRQDEYRDQGMTKGQPSIDTSAGPIDIQVRTRTPLIYYQDDVDFDSNICFIVRNVGDGTPFIPPSGSSDAVEQYKNVDSDNKDKVELTINNVGGVSFDADGGSGNTAEVSIVGNRGIQCYDMTLPDLTTSQISRDVPITLTADYGYYKDDTTQATVLGNPDVGSN
jgi:hypothetical protein